MTQPENKIKPDILCRAVKMKDRSALNSAKFNLFVDGKMVETNVSNVDIAVSSVVLAGLIGPEFVSALTNLLVTNVPSSSISAKGHFS